MSNITLLHPEAADKNADAVLAEAMGTLKSVVVLGWNEDGLLDATASSNLRRSDILWLIEAFKIELLRPDYSEDS